MRKNKRNPHPIHAVITDRDGHVLLAPMMTREEIGLSQKQYLREATHANDMPRPREVQHGVGHMPRPREVQHGVGPLLDLAHKGHFVDGATLVVALAVCGFFVIGGVALLLGGF